MSHPQQREFCERIAHRARGVSLVYDFGSLDVNGNNRYLFPHASYVGIDVAPGPNVDVICKASEFKPDRLADVVISTEMLEHDAEWPSSLGAMFRALRPGGLLIVTCAGPGRPEHGTARSEPGSSPNQLWPDYYANLTPYELREVFPWDAFEAFGLEYERFPSADSRFWGIKKP